MRTADPSVDFIGNVVRGPELDRTAAGAPTGSNAYRARPATVSGKSRGRRRIPTSHRQSPWGGASWPATDRSAATSTSATRAGGSPAPTDVDEGARRCSRTIWWQNARGPDLEPQQAGPPRIRGPVGLEHPTHERCAARSALGRRQNDEKSCSPSRQRHASATWRRRRAAGPPTRRWRQERVGYLGVQHRSSGSDANGRRTGRRSRRRPRRPTGPRPPDRRARSATPEAPGVDRGDGVEAHHLTPGVDTPASVRPAQVMTTGWPSTRSMAPRRAPATVGTPSVLGETPGTPSRRRRRAGGHRLRAGRTIRREPPGAGGPSASIFGWAARSVRDQTSSSLAIGALSPGRGPSLRIRV